MKTIITACILSLATTLAAANGPPAPPMSPCVFGLQDCVNGRCYIQPRVVRQPVTSAVGNVFGLNRSVMKTKTVVRNSPVTNYFVPETVVYDSIPTTTWVEEEIEVPVQKVVTVMEKRTVQRAVVNYEQVAVPMAEFQEVCSICGRLKTSAPYVQTGFRPRRVAFRWDCLASAFQSYVNCASQARAARRAARRGW